MNLPDAAARVTAAARPQAAGRLRMRNIIIGTAVGAAIAAALAGAPMAPPASDPDAQANAGSTPPGIREPLDEFQRHALNLLLLPLVDDSTPPRWQAFGADWVCGGGGEVSVDGRPLVDGATLPASPFVLRWTLHRCPPLGDPGFLVDGVVTMTVSSIDDGLHVAVDACLSTFDGPRERRFAGPFANARPLQFAETR